MSISRMKKLKFPTRDKGITISTSLLFHHLYKFFVKQISFILVYLKNVLTNCENFTLTRMLAMPQHKMCANSKHCKFNIE